MKIPELTYKDARYAAGSDSEFFLLKAMRVVEEHFGEIDAMSGATLISALVAAQVDLFKTFAMNDVLQALDGSVGEISLVMDQNMEVSDGNIK